MEIGNASNLKINKSVTQNIQLCDYLYKKNKIMELNQESFNAKLYCWFYGQRYSNLPTNLCPFFWNLLLAYILLVPYVVVSLPFILIYELKNYANGDNKTGERFILGFFSYFGVYLLGAMGFFIYSLILGIHYEESSGLSVFYLLGSIITVIIVLLLVLGVWLSKNRKKAKKPSMVKEFVKAKYNNYCPQIKWVKNQKIRNYDKRNLARKIKTD